MSYTLFCTDHFFSFILVNASELIFYIRQTFAKQPISWYFYGQYLSFRPTKFLSAQESFVPFHDISFVLESSIERSSFLGNFRLYHATTRFLRKGGAKAPPLFFKGGAFLRKGGAKFFFVRPLPQKLILHHIDTFLMQVSWIGSKRFAPPCSHSFTGAFHDHN